MVYALEITINKTILYYYKVYITKYIFFKLQITQKWLPVKEGMTASFRVSVQSHKQSDLYRGRRFTLVMSKLKRNI